MNPGTLGRRALFQEISRPKEVHCDAATRQCLELQRLSKPAQIGRRGMAFRRAFRRSGSVVGAGSHFGGGAFFGFFETVARAFDVDDFGSMDETVD
jgi:hypothetical protein